MKVKDIIHIETLSSLTIEMDMEEEISGVFIGDLLSWVIGNTEEGQVWLTVQNHVNVVAVAHLRELSAIIFVQGAYPNEETLEQARLVGMPLFVSDLSAYELAKLLMKAGI